jgi:hypothetical protein
MGRPPSASRSDFENAAIDPFRERRERSSVSPMPRDRDRRRSKSQGDVDLILAFVLNEMFDATTSSPTGTKTPPTKNATGTRSESGRARTPRNGSARTSGS